MPPEEPSLIGGKCGTCGTASFPFKEMCSNPKCNRSKPMNRVKLSRRGTLWTYAINYYKPPAPYHPPDPFVPFGVGFISLPERINVGGQISSDTDLTKLKIGMEMEVVRERLYVDEQGREVLTWKFRPV
jgi:uncharacterized protein